MQLGIGRGIGHGAWRGSESREMGSEVREQRTDDSKASRHLPLASLGHYAALSFIVRGTGPGYIGFRIAHWGLGIDERRKAQGTRYRAQGARLMAIVD